MKTFESLIKKNKTQIFTAYIFLSLFLCCKNPVLIDDCKSKIDSIFEPSSVFKFVEITNDNDTIYSKIEINNKNKRINNYELTTLSGLLMSKLDHCQPMDGFSMFYFHYYVKETNNVCDVSMDNGLAIKNIEYYKKNENLSKLLMICYNTFEADELYWLDGYMKEVFLKVEPEFTFEGGFFDLLIELGNCMSDRYNKEEIEYYLLQFFVIKKLVSDSESKVNVASLTKLENELLKLSEKNNIKIPEKWR